MRGLPLKYSVSYTSIYHSWGDMLQRCENPKNKRYKNYGARGIEVCARWHFFGNFYADMGDRPEGLTLERKNNDRNYEPGNCKWATLKEQANNRRLQRPIFCGPNKQKWFVAFNQKTGERVESNNQREFARQFGLDRRNIFNCLRNRLKRHKNWIFSYVG